MAPSIFKSRLTYPVMPSPAFPEIELRINTLCIQTLIPEVVSTTYCELGLEIKYLVLSQGW